MGNLKRVRAFRDGPSKLKYLLVFLFFSLRLAALDPSLNITQYAHMAWTRKDGHLPGSVFAVSQTLDGALWIGTEFGLLRFDGITFLPLTPPAGQRLPSENVWALAPGPDGSLWIGTRAGLARWKSGRLESYLTSEGPSGPGVVSLLVDHSGTVWLGTAGFRSGGLCRLEGSRLHCFGPAEGFRGGRVYSQFQDGLGALWVGSAGGLYRWKPGAALVEAPVPGLKESSLPISSIARRNDGALIVATTSDELHRFSDGKLVPFLSRAAGDQAQMRVLLADRDGGLWIGTNGQGLLHFNQGNIDRYTRADGLSGDLVLNLFEDREGDIWVATNGGLDRFRDLPVATLSSAEGLSPGTVGSVYASKEGGVWVGTGRGLDRVHGKSIQVTGQAEGLPSATVQAVLEDRTGTLWVETDAGLAYARQGQFNRFVLPGARQIRSIAAAAEDRGGGLWFSDFEHGLIRIHDRSVTEIIPWSRFSDRQARALEPDPGRGGIWIGFEQGGLARLKPNGGVDWYSPADGLGGGRVTDLHLSRDGTLWIATEQGLSALRGSHLATLTTAAGLPCDRIHAMVEDDDGALWLNTACGLVRIAASELAGWAAHPDIKIKSKTFGANDGMQSFLTMNGYFRRAVKSEDGRLWFPVLDGVAVVDPRHLPENRVPPPVQIEQILADHKLYPLGSGMKLPALTKDVQVDYTAFSFVAPERVRFRYRLDGYDRAWNEVDGRRQAVYTNLPPGQYRFQVLASNNDGLWNEAGAALAFSILPAFYQTQWFELLCLAAFALVLWALYRLRVRQIATQVQLRFEERLAERTRIARELHDTLLQNITGFALQLGGLSKSVTEPAAAKDKLRDLRQQAEEWLREVRESVWDLRSPIVAGEDLETGLRNTGHQVTLGKSARFYLTVSGARHEAAPRFQEHLLRITQEAARNAIHHGGAHEIKMHLAYLDKDWIRISIQDDGCGFNLEEVSWKSGHWGLETMRERAAKMGADLTIKTAPGQGVEIEIVGPLRGRP
jgi:signal transduction histidine kinase/ligand-binding sensor domain-containing protein